MTHWQKQKQGRNKFLKDARNFTRRYIRCFCWVICGIVVVHLLLLCFVLVGQDVGDLMKDFSVEYIKALIQSKLDGAMDDAVATVFPSGDDEDGGDGGDEKADEKEGPAVVAAGIQLRGYKIAVGPDRVAHRYYDIAGFSIKPEGSVVCKVVRKHGQLTQFVKSFGKQCGDIPKDAQWPKKKMMGKNNQYYRDRYTGMDQYFQKITEVDKVSTHAEFLKYFELEGT